MPRRSIFVRFALIILLACGAAADAGAQAGRDVLLYPTFSHPPDSVLVNGERIDYEPSEAIRVQAGAVVRLEAYLADMWPVLEQRRYAAGSVLRPHFDFKLRPVFVPDGFSFRSLLVDGLSFPPLRFAPALTGFAMVSPTGKPEAYARAGGSAALLATFIFAFQPPPRVHPGRVRVMLGVQRSDLNGFAQRYSDSRRTSFGSYTLPSTGRRLLIVADETQDVSFVYGLDEAAADLEDGEIVGLERHGFAAQVAVRLAGPLGLRVGYRRAEAVPYAMTVSASSGLLGAFFEGTGVQYAEQFEGSLHQSDVDAMITLRIVNVLGNQIDIGAGLFQRGETLSQPFERTLTYEFDLDFAQRDPPLVSRTLRAEARVDRVRGAVGMVSLSTSLTSRIAFVTQYRVLRPFEEPRARLSFGHEERAEIALDVRGQWTSGIEVALF